MRDHAPRGQSPDDRTCMTLVTSASSVVVEGGLSVLSGWYIYKYLIPIKDPSIVTAGTLSTRHSHSQHYQHYLSGAPGPKTSSSSTPTSLFWFRSARSPSSPHSPTVCRSLLERGRLAVWLARLEFRRIPPHYPVSRAGRWRTDQGQSQALQQAFPARILGVVTPSPSPSLIGRSFDRFDCFQFLPQIREASKPPSLQAWQGCSFESFLHGTYLRQARHSSTSESCVRSLCPSPVLVPVPVAAQAYHCGGGTCPLRTFIIPSRVSINRGYEKTEDDTLTAICL